MGDCRALPIVMDPVSALGVAATVVQFVDFTISLVSGTYKIYNSASYNRDENFDLKTITTSLNELNSDLRHSLTPVASTHKLSPRNEAIDTLCKECTKVAEKLLSALNGLSGQTKCKLWGSFQQALRTIWSQEEIQSLKKRLDTFRHQISMQILALLRYGFLTVREHQMSLSGIDRHVIAESV